MSQINRHPGFRQHHSRATRNIFSCIASLTTHCPFFQLIGRTETRGETMRLVPRSMLGKPNFRDETRIRFDSRTRAPQPFEERASCEDSRMKIRLQSFRVSGRNAALDNRDILQCSSVFLSVAREGSGSPSMAANSASSWLRFELHDGRHSQIPGTPFSFTR